jgi:hypothetical protein
VGAVNDLVGPVVLKPHGYSEATPDRRHDCVQRDNDHDCSKRIGNEPAHRRIPFPSDLETTVDQLCSGHDYRSARI